MLFSTGLSSQKLGILGCFHLFILAGSERLCLDAWPYYYQDEWKRRSCQLKNSALTRFQLPALCANPDAGELGGLVHPLGNGSLVPISRTLHNGFERSIGTLIKG